MPHKDLRSPTETPIEELRWDTINTALKVYRGSNHRVEATDTTGATTRASRGCDELTSKLLFLSVLALTMIRYSFLWTHVLIAWEDDEV